jgi:hypothetical protein
VGKACSHTPRSPHIVIGAAQSLDLTQLDEQ